VKRFDKVIIGPKVDLDTIGVGFLFCINDTDTIIRKKDGKAYPKWLLDPNILCIEVGESGRFNLYDFDHHDDRPPLNKLPSATKQAWDVIKATQEFIISKSRIDNTVNYIDRVDLALPRRNYKFPSLAKIVVEAANLKTHPKEQLLLGIKTLSQIVLVEEQNPFSSIYGHDDLKALIKLEFAQLEKDFSKLLWKTTKRGRRIAILTTTCRTGGFRKVAKKVEKGDVIVLHNPEIPKFVIGKKFENSPKLLEEIIKYEPEWVGPFGRKKVISPRKGTNLTLEQVIKIIQEVY
jgi:hypothetical protein